MSCSYKLVLHRCIACHLVVSDMQTVMFRIIKLGRSCFGLACGTILVLRCHATQSFIQQILAAVTAVH